MVISVNKCKKSVDSDGGYDVEEGGKGMRRGVFPLFSMRNEIGRSKTACVRF